MADNFSFEEFAKELPPPAVAVLKEEGFNTLSALLSANANDIERLKMKCGHIAIVRETVKKLQENHRQGPLFTALLSQQMQQALERMKSVPEQRKELCVDNTDSADERAEHARQTLDRIKPLSEVQAVQSAEMQGQQQEGVSCEVARQETMKAVVSDNADAGFWDKLTSISEKYIQPILKAIGSFLEGVGTKVKYFYPQLLQMVSFLTSIQESCDKILKLLPHK